MIYGSASGLAVVGGALAPQVFRQGAPLADVAEVDDQFGSRLTAWNFGRNQCPPPTRLPVLFPCFPPITTADLAVGVPNEDVGAVANAGAVHVIYGSSPNGLTAVSSRLWHQGSAGVPGGPEANDTFGAAVY